MKKVLIVLPVTGQQKEAFEQAAPGVELIYSTPEHAPEYIKEADGVIGNLPPELLKQTSRLRWLQLNSAGAGEYTQEGVLPETVVITNATGAYGVALSEHMMAMLLTLIKKIPLYLENMQHSRWQDEGRVTAIYGSTTLIVGLGDIGEAFARRMKAFGSHIVGIRRTAHGKPDCVDEIYTSDRLKEQLKRADFVAICLPGVKQTCRLFDKEMLFSMKRGALILNVGRGNVIDTLALTEALESGFLSGAALDVTDPEPLPADSPLWQLPGVLITPHVAGGFHLPHTLDFILEISRKNLAAFAGQGEYINVVDRKTGYRKNV